MATENPFEVMTQQLQAAELQTPPQYGPVGRLRFIVWSVGFAALAMLLFVALLTFAGGLGVLAVPLLFIGWAGGNLWLVRARLRNVGLRQWWLLLPPGLLLVCFSAYVVLNSNSSSVLVDALAQITSLLALLTLPLLLICAVLPTAFVDRRKADRNE
ncbi:MAG: hypothetical protein ACK56X_19145 [Planctomyces sp.]|jgi:hypothetical protein